MLPADLADGRGSGRTIRRVLVPVSVILLVLEEVRGRLGITLIGEPICANPEQEQTPMPFPGPGPISEDWLED